MAKQGRYCYREVLPFGAMIFLQCTQVGQSTVFKAATTQGMSYCIFMVYSYAISTLVLLPFAFIFERKHLPPFNLAFLGRIGLLGLLGFSAMMCGYKGIEYSSPTLASAISNLTPAFTFALAILFRMEKLEVRSFSSQAKIIGTIVSISGATIVVLYKGPIILKTSSQASILFDQTLKSSESNWVIGGLLLIVDYLLLSAWYILQAQTVTKYPAELLVVSLFNLCVAVLAAPASLLLEPDLSAWQFSSKMMLFAILYSGLYGSSFATAILTWGLRLKGPVYVALFTPLSIAIAAIMGVIFLGDSLYLGSIIGAVVISAGFYVVMWGKVKEDIAEDIGESSVESPPETDPLL
ncbi:hypothetical protein RJ639_032403 [Escallonia herrerae]|uniref:WAT1-related protein n=1 Tax=Escallonia herrerae TaxID=1293975 RepID=A0AA89B9L6_9ASTE|nr:hypothetical protein RJ639_032403 [Escallonia herrerae]